MTKIGVLRGGPSNEFGVSLQTGKNVLDNFHKDFEAHDVFVDEKSNWFSDGLEISPQKASKKFDGFFNCMHGSYGEDGKVQSLLDSLHTPYTGSGPMSSALASNKFLTKRTYVINNMRVPEHESLGVSYDLDKKLGKIFTTWFMPVIVKPSNSGSSIGVSLAQTFLELKEAVALAFNYSNEVMIEEYIRGREATCGVLEDFRGEDLYTLLPTEVVSGNGRNFISPGRFSSEEKEKIQGLAKLAHQSLGLRHYSQSDFIVNSNGIYILETDNLPELTLESSYIKSLESVGSNLKEFTGHVLGLALDR
jgi:D-alanine-D-alanine ligase